MSRPVSKRLPQGAFVAGSVRPEPVLRDTCRREDIVARSLELPAQVGKVHVEQFPFPLAHLARDHHGLDVRAIHQRYDRTRHLIERRNVDCFGVEDDDVGLFARRERADLVVKPQVLCAVHGGVAQDVACREQARRAGRRCWPPVACCKSRIEDHLVHEHVLQIHHGAHLGEEIRSQRALHVRAQGRLHTKALHLKDRRHAVPHIHLDRDGERDLRAGVFDALPAEVGHSGHVDEQIVGSEPDVVVDATLALG